MPYCNYFSEKKMIFPHQLKLTRVIVLTDERKPLFLHCQTL